MLGLFLILIFCISGCQTDNPDAIQALRSMESTMKQLKPPSVALKNDDKVIEIIIGDYSWSNSSTSISRDIDIPPRLVSINETTPFYLSKPINIKFKKEPNSYKINIWNNEENIAAYESFGDIKERGPHIIEMVALWDEGEVAYVAAVDIQE